MGEFAVFFGPKTNLQPTYLVLCVQGFIVFMKNVVLGQEISKQTFVFFTATEG